MVQAKHEQRVAVVENALIDRLFVSGLIDALEDRDRMSGRFARDLLKAQSRSVKQFRVPAMPCRKFAALHSGFS
jgi:hypothetical protein